MQTIYQLLNHLEACKDLKVCIEIQFWCCGPRHRPKWLCPGLDHSMAPPKTAPPVSSEHQRPTEENSDGNERNGLQDENI
jgi:hypothetical protein